MKLLPHHFLSRLGLGSLRGQLTALFSLLLSGSLGCYTLYVGKEQIEFVQTLERHSGEILAHHLATTLAQPLSEDDQSEMLRQLNELGGNAEILSLTITTPLGEPRISLSRNAQGQLVTTPKPPDYLPPPELQLDQQSQLQTVGLGMAHIIAWGRIGELDNLGWIRLEISPAHAIEDLEHILEDSALTALLTLIVSMLVIRRFMSPPLRSLQRASQFAEQLQSASGQQLHGDEPIHEIRQLINALNQTSTRLHASQSALTSSEARNRAMAEAALDCMISIDERGRITEFNPAAERCFGYARQEALGRPVVRLLFPRPLWPAMESRLQETLQKGPALSTGDKVEITAQRASGEGFPAELAVACTSTEAGRLLTVYVRDISERKHTETLMRQAKEAAEANSRSKSDFLANMSHEIRTPMNAIIGMTELALDTALDTEQREYLSLVKGSADALLGIINDILDFSKIEAGKLDFEHIDFSLRGCIALATRTLQQKAAEKDLLLITEIAPELPDRLMGDPHRLRQVLINLLSNGIKFTQRGEIRLRVEAATTPDTPAGQLALHFQVHDTGIGIAEDKQKLIFEAFSQADSSTTRRYGGTGLGLTISAQLVHAMGGRIEVNSTPGEGSTFHFTVPLEPAPVQPLVEEHAPLENLRVLVLIPEHPARARLVEMLGQWRMSPLGVADIHTALAEFERCRAEGRPYQLVLVGHPLPDHDAFEIARSLHTQAPVILLTRDGQRGDGARCRTHGVAAYLPLEAQDSDLLNAILQSTHPEDRHDPAAPTLITRHSLREQHRALRILLTEDNPVNQTLALRLLSKMGHQVELANNGAEALMLHQHNTYDLILMDVQMPIMGGFEATAAIRAREAVGTPHTPIVAMTAHAMKGDRERCLEAGMDAYISKPIHAPELLDILHQYERSAMPTPLPENPAPAMPAHSDPAQAELPPLPGGPVFDRDKVLQNLGDDEDLLFQLMMMYCDDEARMLDAIRSALEAQDPEALRQAAHALKGAVGNFAANRAYTRALQLEHLGRDQRLAQAPALFASLEQELQALRQAFDLPDYARF
ncbi:MAG: response regulator [Rhodocyclales bacterium]|nr:response regulator [Rhodocyclales bacterium]